MTSISKQKKRADIMEKKNSYRNQAPTDDPSLLEIWELSESAAPDNFFPVSEDETEEALRDVHRQIEPDTEPISGKNPRITERFWFYSKYLVAAIALIIVGSYILFVPATVTAPYGEMLVISLPDGSRAELNSGSSIRYHRFLFGRTGRDVALNGEAYFDVVPDEESFRIEANGTVTRVLGTSFNIRSWNSDPGSMTEITVSTGRVEFMPAGESARMVILHEGEYSRWKQGLDSPSSPEPAAVEEITGWRENRLIFRDQTLAVIIDELERRFNTQIDLEVPEAAGETITAYYNRPQQLRAVLDDISMVKGLRYAETANGYRIFK